MIDGHVHLERGPLSPEYVWEFIDEARRKGISELQILDHTHRFREFRDMYEAMKKIPEQKEWLDHVLATAPVLDYGQIAFHGETD